MSKTRDTGFLANVIQVHDTGVRIMSGSEMLMAISSSGAVTITGELSGSDAANSLLLDGTGSLSFTTTASFLAVSSSQQQISASLQRISSSYANTGSNTFTRAQYISDTSNAISFTSTASLYSDGGLRVQGNSFVSGTAYFNNVVVYGTSSIEYITSSQVNIGSNIITVNTDTPAIRFGGLSVFDSGSTQLTGSIFWDSEKNHWVYSNASGSGGGATYAGGMFISGPRSSVLGSEQGTTACMLLVGQGGDHLTSSLVYHDSTRTCIPNILNVAGALSGSSSIFTGVLNVSYATPILRLTDTAATGNNGNVYLRAEKSGIGYNTLNYIGYEHIFKGGGSESTFLTINSAGSATFACSLTVGSSLSTTGNLNYTSGAGVNWYINPPANGPTIRLKYHGGSTDRNGALGWVDNSGNRYDTLFWQDTSVGIGTSSPDAIFHVAKGNSAGLGGQIVIDNPAGSTVGNTVEISFLTDGGASGAGIRNARIVTQNENASSGAANMQFWTWNGATDTERMRITSGGSVGIASTGPVSRLSLGSYAGSRLPYINGTGNTFDGNGITVSSSNNGNAAIGGGLDLTNNTYSVGAYSPIISFSSLGANSAYNNAYAGIWGVYQGAGGDANWNKGDLVFGTALSYGISERMRISSSGGVSISGALHIVNTGTAFIVGEAGGSAKQLLVGIDSGTGTSELQSVWQGNSYTRLNLNPVAGAVYAGATRLDTLSDSRVKDDIQPITGALSKVLSITGKKFHLKDEEEGKLRYGFIAQELEGKLDEFVLQTNMTFKKDDLEVENVKSIDNWASSWSALLVEAIKEQQCTINTLKTCIGIS